jgi:hypothetical protein
VKRLRNLRRAHIVGAVALAAVVSVVLELLLGATTGNGPVSNGGGLGYSFLEVAPGQIGDFPVTIVNSGSSPVLLDSASLLPIPGFPLPRLVDLGVMGEHFNLLTDRGWPPDGPTASSQAARWSVRPFAGFEVLSAVRLRQLKVGPLPDIVEFGVEGMHPGTDYWAAGLAISYTVSGRSYTARLYEGGGICVVKKMTSGTMDACSADSQRANINS